MHVQCRWPAPLPVCCVGKCTAGGGPGGSQSPPCPGDPADGVRGPRGPGARCRCLLAFGGPGWEDPRWRGRPGGWRPEGLGARTGPRPSWGMKQGDKWGAGRLGGSSAVGSLCTRTRTRCHPTFLLVPALLWPRCPGPGLCRVTGQLQSCSGVWGLVGPPRGPGSLPKPASARRPTAQALLLSLSPLGDGDQGLAFRSGHRPGLALCPCTRVPTSQASHPGDTASTHAPVPSWGTSAETLPSRSQAKAMTETPGVRGRQSWAPDVGKWRETEGGPAAAGQGLKDRGLETSRVVLRVLSASALQTSQRRLGGSKARGWTSTAASLSPPTWPRPPVAKETGNAVFARGLPT